MLSKSSLSSRGAFPLLGPCPRRTDNVIYPAGKLRHSIFHNFTYSAHFSILGNRKFAISVEFLKIINYNQRLRAGRRAVKMLTKDALK